MALTQHRSLLELPFYDIDDTEVLSLNSELLHECDLNGTCLSYQPYRYADYNVCDAMHDVDPVNNHYNYIFPNCKNTILVKISLHHLEITSLQIINILIPSRFMCVLFLVVLHYLLTRLYQ